MDIIEEKSDEGRSSYHGHSAHSDEDNNSSKSAHDSPLKMDSIVEVGKPKQDTNTAESKVSFEQGAV